MSKFILLALIAVMLTGCAAPQAVEPVATPQVLRVEVSSALDWLRTDMAECTQQVAGLGLVVDTVPVPNQVLANADVNLRWSNQTTAGGGIFGLGEGMLTLIVHPDNPMEAPDLSVVKDIYYGQ